MDGKQLDTWTLELRLRRDELAGLLKPDVPAEAESPTVRPSVSIGRPGPEVKRSEGPVSSWKRFPLTFCHCVYYTVTTPLITPTLDECRNTSRGLIDELLISPSIAANQMKNESRALKAPGEQEQVYQVRWCRSD